MAILSLRRTGVKARVLREFSPEEVTVNMYTMVEVLIHNIQMELQHGHSIQDLLVKTCTNFAFFLWTHELVPLDIVLLALTDRDDDPHALRIVISLLFDRQELQQRVALFCLNCGLLSIGFTLDCSSVFNCKRQLGNHLSWNDRSMQDQE